MQSPAWNVLRWNLLRWFVAIAVIVFMPVLAAGCGKSGGHGSGSSGITNPPPPPPPPPPPAPPPAPPLPPPGTIGPNDNGTVGSWGQRFLSATPYTSLLIQVDYVAGEAPTQASLDTLLARAQAHLNKTSGITIQTRALNVTPKGVYSVQDTYNLELAQRNVYATGTQAVQYFIYLDGHSDQDTSSQKVLAWTYTGTSTGVFKETLKTAVNPLVNLQDIEQSVLVHEFGHNLGLVNLGAPLTSSHQDTAHGNHCTNMKCAMFWATEAGNPQIVLQNGGTLPDDYGQECVDDLKGIGGK